MRQTITAVMLIFALLAAAWSGAPPNVAQTAADQPEPGPEPVFIWSAGGGCNMGGRCSGVAVQRDGAVETFFTSGLDQERVAVGSVDPALVDAWIKVVLETDIEALVARAGPPSPWSNPAYDGIAVSLRVPGTGIALVNSRMEFSEDEPFFAAAAALATAANEVATGA